MGDNFKKVQSGQTLRVPAEAFNAFIDSARNYRDRQQSREAESQPKLRRSGIIRIKNGSGADWNRFEALGSIVRSSPQRTTSTRSRTKSSWSASRLVAKTMPGDSACSWNRWPRTESASLSSVVSVLFG